MWFMNMKQKIVGFTHNYIVESVVMNLVTLLALSKVGYPRYEKNTDLMM